MVAFLKSIGNFNDEELDAFLHIGINKKYAPKSVIFQGDTIFSKLFFIKAGIIRSFRLIDNEDYTYYFFSDNDFAVDYQSFLSNTISPLLFETVVQTECVIFNKIDVYALYEKYPRFERLGRLMAEGAYLSAAERLKQYQTDDLKTRYLKLISKNPMLFQTVPLHHIASYLGFKHHSLSRIRAELSGKKY